MIEPNATRDGNETREWRVSTRHRRFRFAIRCFLFFSAISPSRILLSVFDFPIFVSNVKLQRDIRVAIWSLNVFLRPSMCFYTRELSEKKNQGRNEPKKHMNKNKCERAENGWKSYMLFRFEILMQFRFAASFFAVWCVRPRYACLIMVAIKCFMWIALLEASEMRERKECEKQLDSRRVDLCTFHCLQFWRVKIKTRSENIYSITIFDLS